MTHIRLLNSSTAAPSIEVFIRQFPLESHFEASVSLSLLYICIYIRNQIYYLFTYIIYLFTSKYFSLNVFFLCIFHAFNSFSGLVGALGGGLSTLSGYNGLPSVLSGLDDSLSDVAQRKKYPFELEKAIHNVMFIQHHMQRQDEFNAVSNRFIIYMLGILKIYLYI